MFVNSFSIQCSFIQPHHKVQSSKLAKTNRQYLNKPIHSNLMTQPRCLPPTSLWHKSCLHRLPGQWRAPGAAPLTQTWRPAPLRTVPAWGMRRRTSDPDKLEKQGAKVKSCMRSSASSSKWHLAHVTAAAEGKREFHYLSWETVWESIQWKVEGNFFHIMTLSPCFIRISNFRTILLCLRFESIIMS